MAITNSDGSIILTTKVDTSGISKGLTDVKSKFSALKGQKATLATLTQAIKDQQFVLNSLNLEYAEFVAKGKINSKQAQELKARINDLTAEMKEMQVAAVTLGAKSTTAFSKMKSGLIALASYFIGIQTIIAVFRFSGEAGKFATQTEASVQRLVDIYGLASDSVGDFIDANARALGMSKAAAASFSSVYGNLFSVWADQSTNAELTNQYLQMTAVVASKTGRTVEDVQERVRSGLLGNTEAIEDLGIFVNVKTIEMTDAFKRMADGKSWEQLDAYTQQQIRSMAILEQATAKYGDEVADTSATIRNQYKAAYEDFQNSWGNIVNTVLLPVLQVLTQVFDIATKGFNALSGVGGNLLENQEISTGNTSTNIKEQTKNQKELNKELKKSLAGFDEINVLSEETSASSSDNVGKNIKPAGIGKINGSQAQKETSKTLKHIMRAVGAALVGIGVLLIMAKKIGWGIGFIIAGASVFGVTAAAGISEASDLGVGAVISEIMGIIGDALVAVGVMLLFKGQVQWGIGFIVAGAAMLAIEYFATTEFSTDPIENGLIKILGIAGTAMLALGIILCVFGVITPVSIGLIAAGAVTLVSAIALNSDAIVEAIRGPIGAIMAIVGAALLVLGIILICTGVGIPLGMALIAAGAVSLVTVVALNWDAIVDWVKGAWDAVKSFWNRYIAPIFTLKWWANLAIKCGNGLIAGFEGAINGIIWLFETMINWIVDGLNKISITIPDWVPGIGGSTFGINIPRASFEKVSFGRIPELAQGAVIPPNRKFMAILGDQKHGRNLEAPEDLIRQIVREETASATPNFTIEATGSMSQLIKMLNLKIKQENERASVF